MKIIKRSVINWGKSFDIYEQIINFAVCNDLTFYDGS